MPEKPTIPRVCMTCGESFLVGSRAIRLGQGKFCSIACRGMLQRAASTRPCAHCGQPVTFRPFDDRRGSAKYCSEECLALARRKRVTLICEHCSVTFERKASTVQRSGRGRFCSKTCFDKARFRGGAYARNAARRAKTRHAEVVGPIDYDEIQRRDRWVCWICRGKIIAANDLNYDHAVPLSAGGEHSTRNVRMAHKSCNLSKNAKLVTHQPFLL